MSGPLLRVRSINELEGEFRGTTMSGGSFDYACYKAMQFADELRNKLQEQGKDPSGEGWPNPTWPTDVACKLAEIAAFADYVGALMKEAEWLYSGDTGEDTFMCRVHDLESTRGVLRLERRPSNVSLSGLQRPARKDQDGEDLACR
jgi:hypothetical protein